MKNWKEGDRFKNPDKSIGENKGKILTLSLNGWAVIQYNDGQCWETPTASLDKMEKDEMKKNPRSKRRMKYYAKDALKAFPNAGRPIPERKDET